MIPVLYEKNETAFISNGLGRLRDCISAAVTEERNGIYECDFEYPITGAHYDEIQLGRIVGVVTDDTGDFQPFDIVSFSKPIDGVVTFHCVHISYRQSYMTVTGSGISSLSDAFDLLATAEPSNPFTYWTDMSSSAYMAAADGTPRSVRQLLGGVEGSILDAYGGEYEWDKFTVKLWSARGRVRDFTIRYGVNMLEFNDETDSSGTFSSCIPYWTNGETTIVGNRVDSSGVTVTGRGECVPLDLSDKFEDSPTTAQLEAYALDVMDDKSSYLPTQTINVSFIRLQDMEEYAGFSNLLQCGLCDTIKVIFPDYNMSGNFKIVKTVWDVLMDRYESMELGTLSTTLAEALGLDNNLSGGGSSGTKALYNSTKVSSGSLALSEAYTGFDFLVVSYRCNVDEFCKIFDCSKIAANPSHNYHGDITIMNGGTTLSSSCYFSVTDSTHLSVGYFTNNANFFAGIEKVVGVKMPSLT